MSYPEEITLERGNPEFALLEKHSELFRTIVENYSENKDQITLTPTLFGGDDDAWQMFVDVFFPELGVRPFFSFRGNKVSVDPKRGTKEDLQYLLQYMLIDDEDTMMNFAKSQAMKAVNAPQNVVPRGVGVRKNAPIGSYNYNNNYENNNNYNNYNNNNNSGPRMGYTEENEEMLGKLRGKNASKYFPNEGGSRLTTKRKTRRNRKGRKSLKTRRQ